MAVLTKDACILSRGTLYRSLRWHISLSEENVMINSLSQFREMVLNAGNDAVIKKKNFNSQVNRFDSTFLFRRKCHYFLIKVPLSLTTLFFLVHMLNFSDDLLIFYELLPIVKYRFDGTFLFLRKCNNFLNNVIFYHSFSCFPRIEAKFN